ncbi:MAG: hypothetical protein JJU42_09605 [Rhodobacteraceae bacterium]|nr:hypothetical protein [Paracoccaceae bacterium]
MLQESLPTDDWSALTPIAAPPLETAGDGGGDADGGIRRAPEIAEHEDTAPQRVSPETDFPNLDDDSDADAARARALRSRFRTVARQAAMDPDDGMDL